jgi:hypothetical protein
MALASTDVCGTGSVAVAVMGGKQRQGGGMVRDVESERLYEGHCLRMMGGSGGGHRVWRKRQLLCVFFRCAQIVLNMSYSYL